VLEYQLIFLDYVFAANRLRVGETVTNDLEYDIVGRQCKNHHHHAFVAPRVHEPVAGLPEVLKKRTIPLSLALLGTAEHGIYLRNRLLWHHGIQERHRGAHDCQVCMKVRACKSKQHADVVLRKNDGVGDDTFVRVFQCDDKRANPVVSIDASNDIGARRTIKNGTKNLYFLDAVEAVVCRAICVDLGTDKANGLIDISVRCGERIIDEQLVKKKLCLATISINFRIDHTEHVFGWFDIRSNELYERIDADGGKNTARDRAEISLEKLGVCVVPYLMRVLFLDESPQ
jgi:hypothetical protein